VELNELRIGVFLVAVRSMRSITSAHMQRALTDGELDGCLIECPLHAGLLICAREGLRSSGRQACTDLSGQDRGRSRARTNRYRRAAP